MDTKLVHIYGQEAWHEEAWIVGNKKGLKALRAAIDGALMRDPEQPEETNAVCEVEVFTNDGEGYTIYAMLVEGELSEKDKRWNKIAVPYADEIARERDVDAVWPHKLLETMNIKLRILNNDE
jgi:hypothetical protein